MGLWLPTSSVFAHVHSFITLSLEARASAISFAVSGMIKYLTLMPQYNRVSTIKIYTDSWIKPNFMLWKSFLSWTRDQKLADISKVVLDESSWCHSWRFINCAPQILDHLTTFFLHEDTPKYLTVHRMHNHQLMWQNQEQPRFPNYNIIKCLITNWIHAIFKSNAVNFKIFINFTLDMSVSSP